MRAYGSVFLIAFLVLTLGCQPEQRILLQRRTAIDFYGEALKLEAEGNYQQAIQKLLKAAELSPRPAVYYHIGHCYNMLGEKLRAGEYLRLALKEAPDYKLAELELEEVELSLQLASAKKTELRMARVPNKKEERAENLSSANLKGETPIEISPEVAEKREMEVKELSAPLAENQPAELTTPTLIAEAKSKRESVQPLAPAEEAAKTLEKKKPSAEEIRRALFPRLYAEKEPTIDEEMADYLKGRSLIDDPLEYHYQKGCYYMERKLWREASAEFREALRVDENHLESILALAEVCCQSGEFDKAEECYQRALILAPENPDALFKASNFYLKIKNYDRAIELLDTLRPLQPNNPKVYNNLGVAWLKRNNLVKAEDYFKLAIDKDPNFASGYYNLGILYDSYLEQPELALEMYKKYLALGGKNKERVEKWVKELARSLQKSRAK